MRWASALAAICLSWLRNLVKERILPSVYTHLTVLYAVTAAWLARLNSSLNILQLFPCSYHRCWCSDRLILYFRKLVSIEWIAWVDTCCLNALELIVSSASTYFLADDVSAKVASLCNSLCQTCVVKDGIYLFLLLKNSIALQHRVLRFDGG